MHINLCGQETSFSECLMFTAVHLSFGVWTQRGHFSEVNTLVVSPEGRQSVNLTIEETLSLHEPFSEFHHPRLYHLRVGEGVTVGR